MSIESFVATIIAWIFAFFVVYFYSRVIHGVMPLFNLRNIITMNNLHPFIVNFYIHVAGCLIAFACRESFKRGYQGWVFLVPKTYLLQHYPEKYGFTHVPIKTWGPEGFMESNTGNSSKLIKKYLD
jgi:hypothetical protein